MMSPVIGSEPRSIQFFRDKVHCVEDRLKNVSYFPCASSLSGGMEAFLSLVSLVAAAAHVAFYALRMYAPVSVIIKARWEQSTARNDAVELLRDSIKVVAMGFLKSVPVIGNGSAYWIYMLQDQNRHSVAKLVEIQKHVATKDKEIEDARNQLASNETQKKQELVAIQSVLDIKTNELAGKTKEIAGKTKEIETVNETNRQLSSVIGSRDVEIASLTEKLQEQSERAGGEIRNLKTENQALTIENEKLKTNNGELKNENEELKVANGVLTTENGKQKTENEELKRRVEELKNEGTALKRLNDSLSYAAASSGKRKGSSPAEEGEKSAAEGSSSASKELEKKGRHKASGRDSATSADRSLKKQAQTPQ